MAYTVGKSPNNVTAFVGQESRWGYSSKSRFLGQKHSSKQPMVYKELRGMRALRKTVASVDDDVPNMSEELRLSEEENAALRRKIIILEKRINVLEHTYGLLKEEIVRLQNKIAQLSGMELVLVHKMLEACRAKCRALLLQRGIRTPIDWNQVICDPTCVKILEVAGLTSGLPATAYGKKSHQGRGSEAAHTIMESPETYATIVCKMYGNPREQMMNVFEFVFGSKAEDLAFEDI